ncbi:hypothetical protein QP172_03420 [Corynebacterium coyleae]|uniref:hypothetical protein n=1 Tax=Corynebacterium TaxID=1716 RepID=UPI00114D3350|nr:MULTISPECIES: hypothetical protein [Corynebacterium]MDK6492780.1 hypothetical protein [Corynebacterium coyleae]
MNLDPTFDETPSSDCSASDIHNLKKKDSAMHNQNQFPDPDNPIVDASGEMRYLLLPPLTHNNHIADIATQGVAGPVLAATAIFGGHINGRQPRVYWTADYVLQDWDGNVIAENIQQLAHIITSLRWVEDEMIHWRRINGEPVEQVLLRERYRLGYP